MSTLYETLTALKEMHSPLLASVWTYAKETLSSFLIYSTAFQQGERGSQPKAARSPAPQGTVSLFAPRSKLLTELAGPGPGIPVSNPPGWRPRRGWGRWGWAEGLRGQGCGHKGDRG